MGEVWGKGPQEDSQGLPSILRRQDGPCLMLWAVPAPWGLCCDVTIAARARDRQ